MSHSHSLTEHATSAFPQVHNTVLSQNYNHKHLIINQVNKQRIEALKNNEMAFL